MFLEKKLFENVISKKDSVVILGHDNPDVDSIISGYLFSHFLKRNGYNARYVILDKEIDKQVLGILKEYNLNVDDFKGILNSDDKVILVDHHETNHSENVLCVIDHHPTIKKFNYPIYINQKASSTTKLIYDIAKTFNKEVIDKVFLELVILGLLVDTCSFRSEKTNIDDIEWVKLMCEEYGFDIDKLMEIGTGLTDLSDIEVASYNDFKQFKYGDEIVNTSSIKVKGLDLKVINKIALTLQKKVKEEGLFMWMFLVANLEDDTSVEYRIYPNIIDIREHNIIVSRGTNIMPVIEKIVLYY